MTASRLLRAEKTGRKRFPEQRKKGSQQIVNDVAESREETYFPLLININSLNLFQAVI